MAPSPIPPSPDSPEPPFVSEVPPTVAPSAAASEGGAGSLGRMVLAEAGRRLVLSPSLVDRLAGELTARLPSPRRQELAAPQSADRLREENVQLLMAFRQALTAIPREMLPEAAASWTLQSPLQPGADGAALVKKTLLTLEARLGESQLKQLAAGALSAQESRGSKGTALPLDWNGLRLRLLAAAENDLTPRGHLIFAAHLLGRLTGLLQERGGSPAEVRQTAEDLFHDLRERFAAERQTLLMGRFQDGMNQVADVLLGLQNLVEDIRHQAEERESAAAVAAAREPLNTALEQARQHNAGLFAWLKEAGILLPPGVRESLKAVIGLVRELTSLGGRLDDPKAFQEFSNKIKTARRMAQAVSSEFRRVRRKAAVILRKAAARLGEGPGTPPPQRLRDHAQQPLIEAARDLIWSLRDLSYDLEIHDLGHDPELIRLAAAARDEGGREAVFARVEAAVAAQPFFLPTFRRAGKELLDAAHAIARHAPAQLIAQREENHPLWGLVADLADGHERLSLLLEGEERLRLDDLPETVSQLFRRLGEANPGRVSAFGVTAALKRERQCREGELRLSVAERLDNLTLPLRDLVRGSFFLEGNAPGLLEARHQGMQALGVTLDPEPGRSGHCLVELTAAPLAQLFLPCDSRRGRSRSVLERRLREGPVAGLLPREALTGLRLSGAMEGLGGAESAREREERARRMVHRSGLVGDVLGLHPQWETLLASDEALLLNEELRPLFAGASGEGFLQRIVHHEEYLELERLGEAERLEEARLLLSALTSPDGLHHFRAVLVNGACLLAKPPLAARIRRETRRFVERQRDFLEMLGAAELTELLRPLPPLREGGAFQALSQGLESLPPWQQALCVLQWRHRGLLNPEGTAELVRERFSDPQALIVAWPTLVEALVEDYVWEKKQPPQSEESRNARWLLAALGLEGRADAVDQVWLRLPGWRELAARLQGLRLEADAPWWERLAFRLQGGEKRLRRFQDEVRGGALALRQAGLSREAARLERLP
ncbi:MAG: hypothetical protein HQL51_07730 [Magnetococcales bacterium]|nr:hypothetical protein [Magnetococcales bacterium]